MKLKLLKCQLLEHHSPLCIKLSIGNINYQSSWSTLEHGMWNEVFEFEDLNFHMRLFYSIQLDIYTSTIGVFEKWIGRCHIRLLLLNGLNMDTYFEITKDGGKLPINEDHGIGVVHLLLEDDCESFILDILKGSYSLDWPEKIEVIEPIQFVNKHTVVHDLDSNISDDAVAPSDSSWFINQENKNAILKIRDILISFQKGYDNLNPLQWMTGYLMIEKYYSQLKIPLETPCKIPILRINQFHDYAFSSYGWQGINFFNKGQGIFKAALQNNKNTTAIKQYLQHLKEDEFISYFQGDTEMPCHFICYDAVDKAIIVSFRGTMSFADSLIDFQTEYTPWENGFIHSGIYRFVNKFESELLGEIMDQYDLWNAKQVILTGHSLGGAIASILGILWQIKQPFPLQVYSFGCPPILSLNLASEHDHFIHSFIYRHDIVSRVSYGSVSDLVMICANLMTTSYSNQSDAFDLIEKCKKKLKSNLPQFHHAKLYVPGQLYYIEEDIFEINREICEEIWFLPTNMYLDHLPGAYATILEKLHLK
eukprot:NODE_312_length_10013_cov_0.697801.p4 type:complete len:535 gc:universal NODE_312_length_10013_cov_0.697801:7908-6304(-)